MKKKPKEKNEKWIKVCPNCGRLVDSNAVIGNVSTMLRSTRGVDPISDRMSCPDCNYSGFPIEVKQGQHKKIEFRKRQINPFDYRETRDRNIKQVSSIGFLLMLSSLFVGLIVGWIAGALAGLLVCLMIGFTGIAMWLYGLCIDKKID